MKFNKRNSVQNIIQSHPDVTRNYEGGIAFDMDVKTRLYSRVASCLVGEPKFYQHIDEEGNISDNQDALLLADIQSVAKEDPEFILQLAAYARNELYLRTIPVVLLVEASLIKECKPFVRAYTPMIIKRADQLTETIAYLQKRIGHLGNKKPKGSVPSCLKKGLADTMHNFNEYQFAKYNRKGVAKLKDVINLTHPKPKNEDESALFRKILSDELKTPETWEVLISTKGSTKENWEKIAPKMPYMATLRNLRNFLEKKVDMEKIINKIRNEKLVMESKLFPFRFYSAYKEVTGIDNPNVSEVMEALEDAMDYSLDNFEWTDGTSAIFGDHSGSMNNKLSKQSSLYYRDIADIMVALTFAMSNKNIVGVFGSDYKTINLSNRNSILANKESVERIEVGYSTEAWKALKNLINNKIFVDRIILISDMQCYDIRGKIIGMYNSEESIAKILREYKSKVNPDVYFYSIDLAGYGTVQVPQDEPNVCMIAGWSDRILEFIPLFEKDKSTAISHIKKIKPRLGE